MTGSIDHAKYDESLGSLVANGIDFIRSALEALEKTPTEPKTLKYAVLHLHAGVALLLKYRLFVEHWTLVFADPTKATPAKFKTGDFISVGIDEAVSRLEGIAGIALSADAKNRLGSLKAHRNRIEHFGFPASADAVKGSALSALAVVFTEVLPHLDEQIPGSARAELSELRVMVSSLKDYAASRMKELRTRLAAEPVLVECWSCNSVTFVPGAKCLMCGQGDPEGGESAAEYYAVVVLDWDPYSETDNPVHDCPSCGANAMVPERPFAGSAKAIAVCFACAEHWTASQINRCPRCGGDFVLCEDSLCSNCIAYYSEQD